MLDNAHLDRPKRAPVILVQHEVEMERRLRDYGAAEAIVVDRREARRVARRLARSPALRIVARRRPREKLGRAVARVE